MPHDPMLDAALQYAGRGWHVVPLHAAIDGICSCQRGAACESAGKHTRIKWKNAAFPTAAQIEKWWRRWPNANVGILTGQRSGIGVLDIDGTRGRATLAHAIAAIGLLPPTLLAESGREGGGWHAYFTIDRASSNAAIDGLDYRGDGGLVVAPPSRHRSGALYRWRDVSVMPAPMPAPLLAWLGQHGGRGPAQQRVKPARPGIEVPDHLRNRISRDLNATAGVDPPPPLMDLMAAVAAIPNDNAEWANWNRIGMTLWACNNSLAGLEIFKRWSARSQKHIAGSCEERWAAYAGSPPTELHFGTLVHLARLAQPGWEAPSMAATEAPSADELGQSDPADQTETNGQHFPFADGLFGDNPKTEEKSLNPLIELNNKYAAIGDIGGKCLVLSWVPSKVDEQVKVPSFQSFRAFSERYANRYVLVKHTNKDGDTIEKTEQLGSYWLKWPRRKSYEGIDLDPAAGPVLGNGALNLWRGFAVEPRAGDWSRMRWHIGHILAGGDPQSALYILKFAAWAIQHPGDRAEVALVFRGGKGSGKGTFANALKRIFGAHGLQIYSSKHLVGAFNGHLRNCLLLFADEAFWAGDKQGESVLKGMLTEPTLVIEQKGVDAAPWRNRLHVIMAANNEWVVPASHDERRYAMFDVSPMRIGDRAYFEALHAEVNGGGLQAMLHDLQRVDLGKWHPRHIVHTEALREQKERSLDPRHEWWEELLQSGILPGVPDAEGYIPAWDIYERAKMAGPRLREVSNTSLGRFLRGLGALNKHKITGNYWKLPNLTEARLKWIDKFGAWPWRESLDNWNKTAKTS